MIVTNGIIGNIHQDESLGETYETYSQEENVEKVRIEPDDKKRSRIRTTTDAGTEIGIVVEDEPDLTPGDVVALDDERMIVVEFKRREALVIEYTAPSDTEELIQATQLGHVIGNRHWDLTHREGRLYVPLTEEKRLMTDMIREALPPAAEIGYEYVGADELDERHKHAEDGHHHIEEESND